MTVWQAALLGLVQGVTEFLPISSDGHLAFFQILLQLPNELIFDVLLHLATLGAVVIFFRKEIFTLRLKQWLWLAVGTIPAGLTGIVMGDLIEYSANLLWFVGAGFLVTGLANLISQRLLERKGTHDWPPLLQTFIIGIGQAAALLPGVSRSGMTVATGLALGLKRQSAFRFSFLLLIPATIGAVGLESFKVVQESGTFPELLPLVTGMVVAFGTGMGSLKLLQEMVERAKLHFFGYYCLVMGIALIAYSVL